MKKILIIGLLVLLFCSAVQAKLITIPQKDQMWVQVKVEKTSVEKSPVTFIEGESSATGTITHEPGTAKGFATWDEENECWIISGTVEVPTGKIETKNKSSMKIYKPKLIKHGKVYKDIYSINTNAVSSIDIHGLVITFYMLDGSKIEWDVRNFDVFDRIMEKLE